MQRVQENRVNAQVTIALSEPSGFDTEVTLDVGGTAVQEEDFQLMASESFKIPAGQQSADYPINIVEDQVAEYGETLVLTIKSPVNAVIPESNQRSLSRTHTLIIDGDASMNDTGITTFSDGSGGTGLSSEPALSPGQDASHGRDVNLPSNDDGYAGRSLTKLDRHGNPLPASSLSWSCVKDNTTGLVWEGKNTSVDLEDPNYDDTNFRSVSFRYTWSTDDESNHGGSKGSDGLPAVEKEAPKDANTEDPAPEDPSAEEPAPEETRKGACSYRPSEQPGGNCNSKVYVSEVNSFSLCGFKNWRMPDINELRTAHIYFSQYSEAAMDPNFFQYFGLETRPFYFSSTPSADNPGSAWCLDWMAGDVKLCSKGLEYHIRVVRDEKIESQEIPEVGGEE